MKQKNKYSRFFSTDLNSMQNRGIYFILLDNLDENEQKELDAAYYAVADIVRHKEIKMAVEEGWMC